MIRCPKFFYLKLLTVPSQEHNAVNFDRLISSQTRQPLLVKSLPSVDFFFENLLKENVRCIVNYMNRI